ncbi:MAG: hypothetical protein P4L83_08315 [Nevskia sp.]|nr:hypothetical protein [Nevskia sp.]
MMGSYIGEVFRKNHQAEWGWVTLQGNKYPGMHRQSVGLFWPWGKAQGRIVNGYEDNLWNYYQIGLLKPLGVGPFGQPSAASDSPSPSAQGGR